MRNLTGHDVFMALRLLQKIGVKDELVKLAQYINERYQNGGSVTAESQQEIGARLIFGLLAGCGDEAAESAFFEFLAGPMEISAKELKETEVIELCEMVGEFIGTIDRERWQSFFTSLSAAIKSTI